MSQTNEGVLAQETLRVKTFTRNKWLFSIGGIGRDMAYQLISAFLLVYIQFGIPLTVAQFTAISLAIGVGGRIWDAINDPIMGTIIENSNLKWGKFKPWIFIGAVSCGLVIVAMFNFQTTFTGWGFVAFMIVAYLLWESTFTMNDIGYWAMLPSLSSVTKERNSATMLTVLFAGVGAIIAQGLIPNITTGNMRMGYRIVSISVAVFFIGFQILTSFGVKETPRLHEKSEKISFGRMLKTIKNNDQILWMTLSMLFYNIGSALIVALVGNLLYMEIGYVGFFYTVMVAAFGVTSVIVNVIYPYLVGKLGRKRLQLYSILVASLGYALIAVMGWGGNLSIVPLALCAVLISCGQSLFYMSSIVNMTNCVEYNDYKQGERNEAVVSTLRPFMAKFGAALQTLIVTLVLVISGVYGLSQSISTLEAQKSMFANIKNPSDQIQYVLRVQDYRERLNTCEQGSEQYKQMLDTLNSEADNDQLMSSKQINMEYVDSLGDAVIMLNTYDKEGDLVSSQYFGRLSELTETQMTQALADKDGKTFGFTMEVGEVEGLQGDSAADMNFRNQRTTAMRVWLRLAVTALPVLLLAIALIIQRKKFIIDEDYYDMMCAELAKRGMSEGEPQQK